MPVILYKSVHILSDAGLGMAMFSLGKCFAFSEKCRRKTFVCSLIDDILSSQGSSWGSHDQLESTDCLLLVLRDHAAEGGQNINRILC